MLGQTAAIPTSRDHKSRVRKMSEGTEQVKIQRITDRERLEAEDTVVREFPLTIILNNQELVTLLCSPAKLRYLALGFLASEGLIREKADVKSLLLDDRRGVVRVETAGPTPIEQGSVFKRFITSGCGKGAAFYSAVDAAQAKVESATRIAPDQVFSLMKDFQTRSDIFRETGGVHSAALAEGDRILVFCEDIGRHNAIDKIFGECLWEGIPTRDRIILTSGRISSEILFKVAKRGIPILISRSAPTDLAVKTGGDLGITVIGFARGRRMNIYSHPDRVKGAGDP